MLPYAKYPPAGVLYSLGLTLIALPVLHQLGQPVPLVGLGIRRVLRAAVPEATIYEDRYPRPR